MRDKKINKIMMVVVAGCLMFGGISHAGVVVGQSTPVYVKQFEFDKAGRVVRKDWSDGKITVYEWSDSNESLRDPISGERLPAGVKLIQMDEKGAVKGWAFYGTRGDKLDFDRPHAKLDAQKQVYIRYTYSPQGKMEHMLKIDLRHKEYLIYERQEKNVFMATTYAGEYDFGSGPKLFERVKEKIFRKIIKDGKMFEQKLSETLFQQSAIANG